MPARVPLVPIDHGAYVADPSVAFSPDGRHLVYRDGTDVKTIDLRRRTAHTIGWSPSGPVYWLRDGRIAFAARRHRLTYVSAGGHTRTTPLEVSPRWSLSPDGEMALVASRCRARLFDVSVFVAVQPTGTEVTGYQLVEALSLRTLRVSTIVSDGDVGQPLL